MKQKICTSIEQSKKLIELGIDRKTSDMYYWCGEDLRIGGHKAQNDEFDISAWSLSALLNILAGQDVMIKFTERYNEYQYNIDIPYRHCKIWFSSLLDAVFKMIIWLKENNKL
jgi:hypothetical protein